MVEIKWTPFKDVDPQREYTAFSQIGELKNSLTLLSWQSRGKKVQEQLKTTPGFVGYECSLDFGTKSVIVRVFEDEASLLAFAHSGQHASCMATSKQDVKGKMNCYRWTISGTEVPPKIENVLSRFQPKQTLTATA